jgi:hypothetical protein
LIEAPQLLKIEGRKKRNRAAAAANAAKEAEVSQLSETQV